MYPVFKRIQFKNYLFNVKHIQNRPLQRENKSKYVSTQFFTRFAPKQYINDNLIYSWVINAALMAFEVKTSIKLISKSECPNLYANSILK